MTQQNILAAAKQGNPQAIAALMNRSLAAKGLTVKTQMTEDCLHIMLQAEVVPNQPVIVAYVTKGIKGLEVTGVKSLVIYGRQQGADFPDWTERVELEQAPAESSQTVATAEQSIDTPSETLGSTASPHAKGAAPPVTSATSSLKHQKPKLKWYETADSSLIIALLILFFPLGLWSMWKHGQWSLGATFI